MDTTITIGAIGSVVTISTFGTAILWNMRTARRDNAADIRREIAEAIIPVNQKITDVFQQLSQRLSVQETRSEDFMPKGQINDGFQSLRALIAGYVAEMTIVRENQTAMRERIARSEQANEGTNASIGRLEASIHNMDSKLDRVLERRP